MAIGFLLQYPRHNAEVDVQERGNGRALVVRLRGFDGSTVEVILDATSIHVYHDRTELLRVGEVHERPRNVRAFKPNDRTNRLSAGDEAGEAGDDG